MCTAIGPASYALQDRTEAILSPLCVLHVPSGSNQTLTWGRRSANHAATRASVPLGSAVTSAQPYTARTTLARNACALSERLTLHWPPNYIARALTAPTPPESGRTAARNALSRVMTAPADKKLSLAQDTGAPLTPICTSVRVAQKPVLVALTLHAIHLRVLLESRAPAAVRTG